MKWKDFILKNVGKSGMVVSTYNLGIGDTETGDAAVQSHCELRSEHQVSRGHKVK